MAVIRGLSVMKVAANLGEIRFPGKCTAVVQLQARTAHSADLGFAILKKFMGGQSALSSRPVFVVLAFEGCFD